MPNNNNNNNQINEMIKENDSSELEILEDGQDASSDEEKETQSNIKDEKRITWRKMTPADEKLLTRWLENLTSSIFFLLPLNLKISDRYARNIGCARFIVGNNQLKNENLNFGNLPIAMQIEEKIIMFRRAGPFLLIYCNAYSKANDLHKLFNQFLLHLELNTCSKPQLLTNHMPEYAAIASTLEDNEDKKNEAAKNIFQKLLNKKLYILPEEFILSLTSTKEKQVRFVYILDKSINVNLLTNHYGSYFGEKEQLFLKRNLINLMIIYCPIYSQPQQLLNLFNQYLVQLGLRQIEKLHTLTQASNEYQQIKENIAQRKSKKREVNAANKKGSNKPRKKSTPQKDAQIIHFFSESQFYQIGNNGDILLYKCESKQQAESRYKELKYYAHFHELIEFKRLNNKKTTFFLYFPYNDALKKFLAQHNSKINHRKIVHINKENSAFTSVFDFSGNKHFKEKDVSPRKDFFNKLVLATVAEKAVWVKNSSNDNECDIYFSDDILGNMKLIGKYLKIIIDVFRVDLSNGFDIILINEDHLHIKNYQSFMAYLENQQCDTPMIVEENTFTSSEYNNNNKRKGQPIENNNTRKKIKLTIDQNIKNKEEIKSSKSENNANKLPSQLNDITEKHNPVSSKPHKKQMNLSIKNNEEDLSIKNKESQQRIQSLEKNIESIKTELLKSNNSYQDIMKKLKVSNEEVAEVMIREKSLQQQVAQLEKEKKQSNNKAFAQNKNEENQIKSLTIKLHNVNNELKKTKDNYQKTCSSFEKMKLEFNEQANQLSESSRKNEKLQTSITSYQHEISFYKEMLNTCLTHESQKIKKKEYKKKYFLQSVISNSDLVDSSSDTNDYNEEEDQQLEMRQ